MTTPASIVLARVRKEAGEILNELSPPQSKKELAAHIGLAMIADPSMEPVGDGKHWKPAESFTVASYISEEMECRGWTLLEMDKRAGWRPEMTNKILAGKQPIGEAEAEGLSKAFGTGTQLWINLYAAELRGAAPVATDNPEQK